MRKKKYRNDDRSLLIEENNVWISRCSLFWMCVVVTVVVLLLFCMIMIRSQPNVFVVSLGVVCACLSLIKQIINTIILYLSI